MSKLADKVAVVTGASKGIGAAIAKAFAAEGAAVVVNYASSREGAEAVVREITGRGGKAIAVQGDVARADDVRALFAATKQAFGRVDVLVNNAGVYAFTPLEAITEQEYRREFDTNVLGLLLATQEAVRHIGEAGGSIINIGSTITSLAPPMSAIYTATKAAVTSITDVLSKELGPRRIRVNAINPGGVETEGSVAVGMIGSDMATDMIGKTPLGRMGQVDDIAPVAVFLASDDAKWITGESLRVAGGMR